MILRASPSAIAVLPTPDRPRKRVVLGPAAQDLHRAVDLGRAADQRVDAAVLRLFVEVDGELLERGFALFRLLSCLGSSAAPFTSAGWEEIASPLPTPWEM
jgi:hypothetical protein